MRDETQQGERLSALDATFLELEQLDQSAHMHIGAVLVFESYAGGPAPPLDLVTRHVSSRLGRLPRFTQRLSEPTTGGLRWPRWVRDERSDVGGHVRRERLPPPGGRRELQDWAAEFFSRRLDRTRPLWEMVVLDGLSGGRWALATKTHHCMVDGVGSVDIGTLMLDESPRPGPNGTGPQADLAANGAGPRRGGIRDRAEALLRMPLRAARDGARAGLAAADAFTHPARARTALRTTRAVADILVRDELIAAPHTSLNEPIGAKRRFAVAEVSLEDVKQVKRRLGGTVNDVVLAVSTGGLRRLLLSRGEALPGQGLRAMVPVNLRDASQRLKPGNRIASLFVPLPVVEPDPLRRYRAQMAAAEQLKSGNQALGAVGIIGFTSLFPPLAHTFLARSLYATRLFNVTVTNVPGPQLPLYAFGSRMEAVLPLVPLAAEHAIGLAILSYDGKVFFAVNADYDTVGDIDVLVGGIEESLAELLSMLEPGDDSKGGRAGSTDPRHHPRATA